MITDNDGNVISPPITKEIYDKMYKIRSYKTFKIVLFIYSHGIVSCDKVAHETKQNLNYIEELLYKIEGTNLVQKLIDEEGTFYYGTHTDVLNTSYCCNGCKYAKGAKAQSNSGKTIKYKACTLKGKPCHAEYFRKIKSLRKLLRADGLQAVTFREKKRIKHTLASSDKALEKWTKRDFAQCFFNEFKSKYQHRITDQIQKLPFDRDMGVLYNIFKEDYDEEDYKFYLFRYIRYSFRTAEEQNRMPSLRYMSNKKYIKTFLTEDGGARSKKCSIHNIYCPYFKNKECKAGVKCTKRLRRKIKKCYNK